MITLNQLEAVVMMNHLTMTVIMISKSGEEVQAGDAPRKAGGGLDWGVMGWGCVGFCACDLCCECL